MSLMNAPRRGVLFSILFANIFLAVLFSSLLKLSLVYKLKLPPDRV